MDRGDQPEGEGRAREPVLRAPWPVVALTLLILAGYAVEPIVGVEAAAARWGLRPADVARGRLGGLVSALFVHASWMHAGLNGLAALAFGVPVARLLGSRARAGALFFLFYLACGAAAGLVFVAVHPGEDTVLIGASGAVSGLVGASSRLAPGRAGLAPILSPRVLAMAGGWIAANLLLGLAGIDAPGSGAPLAWEAHLGGYAAGLFALSPLLHLGRRSR